MGRLLIYIGFALIFLGVLFIIGERTGIRFGRLPGDIVYRGRNTTFYFPIVTCILLSAVLTLISWLLNRR
ncbi:MAG TPA: DUF2905 domain-containing protein [Bryobacteraceae bacterium]|jgi:hypothetical protein|nr:DUF2905 domain-containing protein [Bryobacteraceae bacterium]